MENNLYSEEPISLYNTDKKELIGIFTSFRSVAKYMFDHGYCHKEGALRLSLNRKAKILCDKLKCTITLRYANATQKEQLEGKLYYIADDYPKPIISGTITQEFSSSRLVMATKLKNKRVKTC